VLKKNLRQTNAMFKLAALNSRHMKFLGFLVFLTIFLMGFGMLIFLGGFVGYWLTLLAIEKVSPSLAHKIIGYTPEDKA
jgi:hypothetical protein